MKRSQFKSKPTHKKFAKPDYAALLARRLEKSRREPEKPSTGRKRLGAGRRMKDWAAAWRFLKPRLEAAGRVHCEFAHVPHECSGILTPAHSKKRREMEGLEIYEVAICCTNGHRVLDEKLTHEAMYVAVNYAIERAGGLILPDTIAARRAAA